MSTSSHDTGNQKRKHALALACVWSLRWEIAMTYFPRLCYAALNISQVYLIQDAVRFVEGTQPNSTGYGLVGATAIIYTGLAVSIGN